MTERSEGIGQPSRHVMATTGAARRRHDREEARDRRTGAAGRGAAAPGRYRPGPCRLADVRAPGLGGRIRGAAGALGAGRRSGVSAAGFRSLPAHRLGHRRPVGAAAVLAVALARVDRWHWPLALASWAGSATLVLLCPLLLLDVVGLTIPGLGLPRDPAGILGRVGALTGGLLLAAAARAYWRRCRDDRPALRWIAALVESCAGTGTPRWARIAGYLAVTGCLVRLAAQYAVGMAATPFPAGPSVIVFEVGFLLAGVLLPLALVHPWGGCSHAGCRCSPAGGCPVGCCSGPDSDSASG